MHPNPRCLADDQKTRLRSSDDNRTGAQWQLSLAYPACLNPFEQIRKRFHHLLDPVMLRRASLPTQALTLRSPRTIPFIGKNRNRQPEGIKDRFRRHLNMNHLPNVLLFLLALSCCCAEASSTVSVTSNGYPRLVELYTSQGCNSCPPAEEWIGKFVDHPHLWTAIVPVVFHVDYWDRLGWRDPFAKKAFTARQLRYRDVLGLRNYYTPGFFVNGQEWRGYYQRRPLPPAKTSATRLHAQWDQGEVKLSVRGHHSDQIVHVALLGFDLSTHVKRGENAGRQLRQNFVTLSLKEARLPMGQTAPALLKFSRSDLARPAPKYGFAAWTTPHHIPIPTRAIGGWIPKEWFETPSQGDAPRPESQSDQSSPELPQPEAQSKLGG